MTLDFFILLPIAAILLITYCIYSVLVNVYARPVVRRMQAVPSPSELVNHLSLDSKEKSTSTAKYTICVKELHQTISRATNLVENPSHRKLWNQWAVQFLQEVESSVASNDGRLANVDHLAGCYAFAYRSYIDDEEKTPSAGHSNHGAYSLLRL